MQQTEINIESTVLHFFYVFFNYCKVRKNGKHPAGVFTTGISQQFTPCPLDGDAITCGAFRCLNVNLLA